MKSLKNHEGYLLIDNRCSVGVPDEIMVGHGLPVGSGKGVYEASTYTCNHCGGLVIMNSLRAHERGYCRKCSHRICDNCNAIRAITLECKPMEQVIDELLNKAVKLTERV